MSTSPPPPDRALTGELSALSRLTGPLLLTHLGQMFLGVVDVAVVGRLGEVPLAAVGLGNALFFAVAVLGLGWMFGLDPLIAQAVGAGEHREARRWLHQGLWVALFGGLPLSLLLAAFGGLLESVGVAADAAAEVGPYLWARLPGLVPLLWLAACRAYLQGHAITRPLVIGVVIANVLNLPLTFALVFGDEALGMIGAAGIGLPALGTMGAGVASTVATLVQLAVSAWAVRAVHAPATRPNPSVAWMLRVLKLGIPIGLTLLAEVGSFTIVTLLMGTLSVRALGAHNVALTLISVSFQVALALGAAGAVRVGQAIGRGDAPGTRRSGLVAIGSGALAMTSSALAFWFFPEAIASVITNEPAVIEAALPLLAIAAAFQLSDGVQAVAAGALRGAGDTRWPLAANLIGHYGVGLPLGCLLTFGLDMGPSGLWWGLSAGLSAVALALTFRFIRLSARPIRRA